MPTRGDIVTAQGSTPAWASKALGAAGTLLVSDGTDLVYSGVWTDYSSISTVVGWAATPTIKIYYKKVGKLVFVQFDISGTSDSSNITFTLPYSMQSNVQLMVQIHVKDNTVDQPHPGLIVLSTGSDTVYVYKDNVGNGFTSSGLKLIAGQFWYETA